MSVHRLLREKFTLGLFDRRHVHPEAAERTVGRADFRAAGRAAQRASVTLLRNAAPGTPARLPMRAGLRVFCTGVSRRVVARNAVIVDRPEDADVALLRLQAPYEPRTGPVEAYFHAGSLAFPPQELARILAITDTVASIVDVYLDRPAVLTKIAAHAATLLVTFGVEDEPLLDVLTGRQGPARPAAFRPAAVDGCGRGRPARHTLRRPRPAVPLRPRSGLLTILLHW